VSVPEHTGRAGRTEASGVSDAVERAFRELPAGSSAERLSHYCGRVFDVLRASDFGFTYRTWLLTGSGGDGVQEILGVCLSGTAALVLEGIDRGEFSAKSPHAAARLLVSSLVARAHWCTEGLEPGIRGACSRVVKETLEILWPALGGIA
jgi:hypothetical protein